MSLAVVQKRKDTFHELAQPAQRRSRPAAYGASASRARRLPGDGARGRFAAGHPVSPLLRENRLFVFMYPTSPKAHDLQRGGRYALHCAVEDREGGEGEFYVRGTARQTTDPADWELVRPGHADEFNVKYILFEFAVEQAFSMVYVGDDTVVNRWKKQ